MNSVLPLVSSVVASYAGVACEGGTLRARPASMLGFLFYPDVGIVWSNQRLIAIEVKYLQGPTRQGSLAMAIGQAEIYRLCGYEFSLALLINRGALIRDHDIPTLTAGQSDDAHRPIVVLRQATRMMLLPAA